ncbi:hypothetical protein [Shewanella sp. 30m-9]
MSPIEQVLAAAKRLDDEGKAATLALIKTKLGNSIAMPILIQGLQQFKSMSNEDKKALSALISTAKESDDNAALSHSEQANKITQLEQEFSLLKGEFSVLKQQYSELKQQLSEVKTHQNTSEGNNI